MTTPLAFMSPTLLGKSKDKEISEPIGCNCDCPFPLINVPSIDISFVLRCLLSSYGCGCGCGCDELRYQSLALSYFVFPGAFNSHFYFSLFCWVILVKVKFSFTIISFPINLMPIFIGVYILYSSTLIVCPDHTIQLITFIVPPGL